MAMVDSAETPITVNSVALSLAGCDGSAAESASAAEAPQIAVAPPLSRPYIVLKPIIRATAIDTRMVITTEPTTSRTGCQPRADICSKVMRTPSRATPILSSERAANSMPGRQTLSSVRKFSAIPSSSANSISGAW